MFFLKKIWRHIVPYCDILAYCLMPNHFHLMVLVNKVELLIDTEGFAQSENFGDSGASGNTEGFAVADNSRTNIELKDKALRTDRSEALGKNQLKSRTLNQSIGIMLRSYTNAINKQNNTSGSLFRKQTKAEPLNQLSGLTPSFYDTNAGTKIHIDNPEKQYPQICFNYIHLNPVNAGLAAKAEDWEYSSAKDYAGLRNGKLVNMERAKEFIDF